jgi:hypothetical protein
MTGSTVTIDRVRSTPDDYTAYGAEEGEVGARACGKNVPALSFRREHHDRDLVVGATRS